jgi:hypothetical protein
MKATLKGRILSVKRTDGDAEITFTTKGKVDKGAGVMAPTARETSLDGTLKLKEVVANEIKIGAVITIEINDEESDERFD